MKYVKTCVAPMNAVTEDTASRICLCLSASAATVGKTSTATAALTVCMHATFFLHNEIPDVRRKDLNWEMVIFSAS
jgi:hypothetical protein